jgi:hypothetical protein
MQLVSLVGRGGANLPIQGQLVTFSRSEVTRIVNSLSPSQQREVNYALRRGDHSAVQAIYSQAATSVLAARSSR